MNFLLKIWFDLYKKLTKPPSLSLEKFGSDSPNKFH
jgi:hypothetical protein